MADQLRRVNEIGELANVSVRVVPAGPPNATKIGEFEIVDVPPGPLLEHSQVLYRRALDDDDSRELVGEVAWMFGRRCRASRRLVAVPRVGQRER